MTLQSLVKVLFAAFRCRPLFDLSSSCFLVELEVCLVAAEFMRFLLNHMEDVRDSICNLQQFQMSYRMWIDLQWYKIMIPK